MSTPTWADHVREPTRYPTCSEKHVWRQRGNVTGHCAKCHQTFEGITLFDLHQTTDENGRTHCKPPTALTVKRQPLENVDGVWRGPRMPADVLRAHLARRGSPTEQVSHPQQTPEQPQNTQPGTPATPDAPHTRGPKEAP